MLASETVSSAEVSSARTETLSPPESAERSVSVVAFVSVYSDSASTAPSTITSRQCAPGVYAKGRLIAVCVLVPVNS